MMAINFVTSIMEKMEPPCEKYKCKKMNECAERMLACDAFALYVALNKETYNRRSELFFNEKSEPDKNIYKKIFKFNDENTVAKDYIERLNRKNRQAKQIRLNEEYL